MKKLIAISLAVIMALLFAACGAKDDEPSTVSTPSSSESVPSSSEPSSASTSESMSESESNSGMVSDTDSSNASASESDTGILE